MVAHTLLVHHADAAQRLAIVLPFARLAEGADVLATLATCISRGAIIAKTGPVAAHSLVRVRCAELVWLKEEYLTRAGLLVALGCCWSLLLERLALHHVSNMLHVLLHVLYARIRYQRNVRRR